jgi:hypothetical protein
MAPMADHKSGDQEKAAVTSTMPGEYSAILEKMIEGASQDPSQVRKLVYALAWHKLLSEVLLSQPILNDQSGVGIIFALEQAHELKRAIEQLETPRAREDGPISKNVDAGSESFEANALVVAPERPPVWMLPVECEVKDFPSENLKRRFQPSSNTIEYVPREKQRWKFHGLLFLQFFGAVILSISFFGGIFGWAYLGLRPALESTRIPLQQPVSIANVRLEKESVSSELSAPSIETQLTFLLLPKTFGVYISSKGQLIELATLPIRIPDPRVPISAEIKTPSQSIVAGGDLSFIVFKRDLLNSAPQTVSVRNVARVVRQMKFAEQQASVVPVENSWRIRDKAYEFKVSPVENSREMILIKPRAGFTFPAGRYALVLNGLGYDFTVAGPITAPEQCLEQVEVLNGTVLSECPKSR